MVPVLRTLEVEVGREKLSNAMRYEQGRLVLDVVKIKLCVCV